MQFPHCHQTVAVLSLIVNINEKMDSKRLVEEVRARPILFESNTKSYKRMPTRRRRYGEQLLQNWKSPVDAILIFTKLTTTTVK